MSILDDAPVEFHKDGVAHCAECGRVVDIQQGTTIKVLRSSWMRMDVTGRCGHSWTIKVG